MTNRSANRDATGFSGSGESSAVLLIDDEADSLLPILTQKVGRQGFRFFKESKASLALDSISEVKPALVLLDLHFPGDDRHDGQTTGGRLLVEIRRRYPDVAVIVFTTRLDDVEIPLESFGEQPHGFYAKPDFGDNKWPNKLAEAMRAAVSTGAGVQGFEARYDDLVWIQGVSTEITEVVLRAQKAAGFKLSVLIVGEEGAGKSVVAEAIHRFSNREGSFLTIDCGEESDQDVLEAKLFGYEENGQQRAGVIESASGGTLFLRGIDQMPLPLQGRLLGVLSSGVCRPKGGLVERPVDLRLIAATSHEFADLVADGVLREDLVYTLAQFVITVPPLRQRLDDLPQLFSIFLAQAAQELGRSVGAALRPEVMAKLKAHPWHGNLRELQATVFRAVASTSSNVLLPQDFELLPLGKSAKKSELPRTRASTSASSEADTELELTLRTTDHLESLPLEARYTYLLDLAKNTQSEVLIEFIRRLRLRSGKRVTHKVLASELDPLSNGESDFAKVRHFVCGRVKLTQLEVNQ